MLKSNVHSTPQRETYMLETTHTHTELEGDDKSRPEEERIQER